MTTESQIDDTDLGEMLYIACMYRDCGFKTLASDTEVQIELLKELIRLRENAELRRKDIEDADRQMPAL